MSSAQTSVPFLKLVLAVVVGIFAFFMVWGLFSVLFIGMIVGAASSLSLSEAPKELKEGSVLELRLKGPLSELSMKHTTEELWKAVGAMLEDKKISSSRRAPGLIGIAEAIRSAAHDPKIEGISMHIDELSTGLANLEELHDALSSFKASGKFIYAYSEHLGEPHQLLSSLADTLMMYPYSTVEFDGFVIKMAFYRGTLDWMGLKPRVFRRGKYKSAVEPFTEKSLSEPTRLQYTELLNSLYDSYLSEIAATRGCSMDSLRTIAEQLSVWHADHALAHGFVTLTGYKSSYDSLVRARLKLQEQKPIPLIPISQYQRQMAQEPRPASQRISVIIAEGAIHSKKTEDEAGIAPETFIPMLRRVAEDDQTKAIVIRINSPGGSFVGSDKIWNEIRRVAQKKPVIASMGRVAASGGYYIAMACDTIIAYPSTITGSIGVFAMVLEAKELLTKLKIEEDRVQSTPHAHTSTYNSRLSPEQERILSEAIDRIYEVFTSKAAMNRPLSTEEVKKVAEGRVWTGRDAYKQRLVDETGFFRTAIKAAAAAAKLSEEDYYLQYVYALDPAQIIASVLEEIAVPQHWTTHQLLSSLLPNEEEVISEVSRDRGLDLYSADQLQARMPYEVLEIH